MEHNFVYTECQQMECVPDFTSLLQCLADSPAEQLWPGILHTYLISESSIKEEKLLFYLLDIFSTYFINELVCVSC